MVEKLIKDLLYTSDCVIVPGLGGFICNYAGSEISISKNKISPPYKKIAFNEKLVANDQILADNLISHGFTYPEATQEIEKYVQFVKHELNLKKTCTIEQLGRLYLNKEGHVHFEQSEKFNYLLESFGLPDLYFTPIDRTKEPKFLFQIKNNTHMVNNTTDVYDEDDDRLSAGSDIDEDADFDDNIDGEKKSENLSIYYVMSFVVLFFVTATTYYLNMDKETYAVGSFNPLGMFNDISGSDDQSSAKENKLLPQPSETTTPEETTPTTEEYPESTPPDTQTPAVQSVPEAVASTVVPENNEASKRSEVTDAITGKTGKYYLIIGSFKKVSKALLLSQDLSGQGQSPKLIIPENIDNPCRVAIGEYASYQEAIDQKAQLTPTFGEDIWVLNY